jgi:hypothetical protein
VIRPGMVAAAIEKLRALRDGGRLSRAERRAVVLLGGGAIHAPKKKLNIPGETKQQRDAKVAAETARIRAACVARAEGIGELCGNPLDPERAQLCHLDGGSGKRRTMQSVRNCLMEHHECHQGPLGFDKKPLAWLHAVTVWAARCGYPVPERFRKLEALRGADTDRRTA